VNFVGAQRLALVGGQAVGRPWGRRGRAEGHVTQLRPATGSLRTMPMPPQQKLDRKQERREIWTWTWQQRRQRRVQQRCCFCFVLPRWGRGGLGGALGVLPPVVIRQGPYTRHDTTRHDTTRTPLLVDQTIQRLVANQPPQRLCSQRLRVNSLTCCPLTAYASLGLS
jgi:hypothetical protein